MACSDDDEAATPLSNLGRFDGWQITTVESNLAEQISDAIYALPDSVIAQNDTTRVGLLAAQEDYINRLTGLEPCEQDDVLFFESGVSAYGRTGEPCPATGNTHILTPFHEKSYSSDLEVTRLTLTDPVSGGVSEYNVERISASELVLSQQRTTSNAGIIPAYTYNIRYRFTAR